MTRRILLALVVFTAVVITGAMLPLALNTIAHDRSSFVQATQGMVRTDAAVAQARLEAIAQLGSLKAKPYAPLVAILNQAQQNGDRLLILQSKRTVTQITEKVNIQKGKMPVSDSDWLRLAEQADAQSASAVQDPTHQQIVPATEVTGSWVVAATPAPRSPRLSRR